MLCSYGAGKSGSRWLDRLRTAKGFPEDASSNLENFLQNRHSPNSEVADQSPRFFDASKNEENKLVNMMSNVICELFNFGESRGSSAQVKKSARKQTNPKVCSFLNNRNDATANVDSERVLARSDDSNNGVGVVKESNEGKDEGEGEGDVREVNLPGFSRSEVTVIDTSYEVWKFDKLLFRKKNVWKVRDKKGRSESVWSKKKRKRNLGAEDDRRGKKQKIEDKEGCGEESRLSVNETCHQRDKLEAPEKTTDKVGKLLKKHQVNTLSEKLETTESSSIILIKSIPPVKKNGISTPKSCLKSKQNKP